MNKQYSQSKSSTKGSQTSNLSCSNQTKIKIYRIGVQKISVKSQKNKTPLIVYLNLKLKGQEQRQIQTPCLEVLSDKKHFMIKSQADIQKIEVIDYDSMKKLSKISLKGINKQFSYTHTQEKNLLKIALQMTYEKVEVLKMKSHLVESIIYQEKEFQDLETQESESQSIY